MLYLTAITRSNQIICRGYLLMGFDHGLMPRHLLHLQLKKKTKAIHIRTCSLISSLSFYNFVNSTTWTFPPKINIASTHSDQGKCLIWCWDSGRLKFTVNRHETWLLCSTFQLPSYAIKGEVPRRGLPSCSISPKKAGAFLIQMKIFYFYKLFAVAFKVPFT